MKYRLMDVLACPYDKTFPLTLIVLREREYPERKYEWSKRPFCEEYCALKNVFIKNYPNPQELPCDECIKKEVVEAYCTALSAVVGIQSRMKYQYYYLTSSGIRRKIRPF